MERRGDEDVLGKNEKGGERALLHLFKNEYRNTGHACHS